MSKDWILSTNVYEVNLRQYTEAGKLNAFAEHLPRLKDMGVETLWFMPFTPISEMNRKGTMGSYYACSDYTSVSPEFGTMEDWKQLVSKAHDSGFKVIIDWVANHTGWDHVWTREHPEWYKKDETGTFKKASGMDDIIELDFENPAVRRAMIDAMKFWVQETGIDGFRCDLAFWVTLSFWEEAKKELELTKPLFWLGELDVLDNPEYMKVFDAAYTWRWMHKAEDYYKQHLPLSDLLGVLEQYTQAPGLKTWFTSNHDENSWNGTEYEKYGQMAKALAVFSCTWPGIPLIYSGQEISNNKRLQFFEKDPIEWNAGDGALGDFYKILLREKKNNTALAANAAFEILQNGPNGRVFAFRRSTEEDHILVFLNLSGDEVKYPLSHMHIIEARDIFTGAELSTEEISLSPWNFCVLAI